MVSEILMAMQGNKNIALFWKDGRFTVSSPTSNIDGMHYHQFTQMTLNAPRLIHLSLASQASIISSLAKIGTTVEQL